MGASSNAKLRFHERCRPFSSTLSKTLQALPRLGNLVEMTFLASISFFACSVGERSLPSDEELDEDEVDGWRARDLLGGDDGIGKVFGISSFCDSWFSVA